jgi:hypothetical protein
MVIYPGKEIGLRCTVLGHIQLLGCGSGIVRVDIIRVIISNMIEPEASSDYLKDKHDIFWQSRK